MSALLVRRPHRGLKVSHIVQAVEDTDDVDSIRDGFLHEILYHVVAVGTVAQNVLAAEQHLQRRFLCLRLNLAQSLPGILVHEA